MIARWAIAAAICFSANAASAKPERCLLEVDGKPHLLGRCNVDRNDAGIIGVGVGDERARPSPFFAYVYLGDNGSFTARWNETLGVTHADVELGELRRDGACWSNARARICAWP